MDVWFIVYDNGLKEIRPALYNPEEKQLILLRCFINATPCTCLFPNENLAVVLS